MSEFKPSSIKKIILGTFAASVIVGGGFGGVLGYVAGSSAVGKAPNFGSLFNPAPISAPAGNSNANSGAPSAVSSAPIAGDDAQLAAMVKKTAPSVVSIIISKSTAANRPSSSFYFDPFSPFGIQITPPTQGENAPSAPQEVGSGSGFIISPDGLIVTNRHVVSDAGATYTVVLSDGSRHDAKVLARDPMIDLALVKIEASNLPALALGNSDQLELGQTVVAIGNSLGQFSNSVTKGIISGKNRTVVAGDAFSGSEVIDKAIQTDAAINPGNSGGPLLTLDGNVVGVNTAVSSQGQSVGFAIPINVAKPSIQSVVQSGKIVRPYLGVRYVMIDPTIQEQNKLPVSAGAWISSSNGNKAQAGVVAGSPADKAGLKEGDIVTQVSSVSVDQNNSLADLIAKYKPGDSVTLQIYRDGKYQNLTATVGTAPTQ